MTTKRSKKPVKEQRGVVRDEQSELQRDWFLLGVKFGHYQCELGKDMQTAITNAERFYNEKD